MIVLVRYQVPVVVEVEMCTGEVNDVHVLDDSVGRPLGVTDLRGNEVSPMLRQIAIEVARAACWPSWTFGF